MFSRSSKSSCAPCASTRRSRRTNTQRIIQQSAQRRVRAPLATKYVLCARQAQLPPTAVTTTQLRLPRSLGRPQLQEVDLKPIEAVYPELAGVPAEYVREHLVLKGADMLAAVADVHVEAPKSCLPKELDIVVTDTVAASCPTHMLAVYSPSTPCLSQKRKVTLFPVHDLVLSAHCANLPSLPVSQPHAESSSTITLPVVPLCLPSAETFSILQSYLYTKRTDALLATILPQSPTPCRTISDLFESCSLLTLGHHAMLINGLWRNACALGVNDEKLWGVIAVAWDAIIRAMAGKTVA